MYDAIAGFSVDAINPFRDTSFPADQVFVDEVSAGQQRVSGTLEEALERHALCGKPSQPTDMTSFCMRLMLLPGVLHWLWQVCAVVSRGFLH